MFCNNQVLPLQDGKVGNPWYNVYILLTLHYSLMVIYYVPEKKCLQESIVYLITSVEVMNMSELHALSDLQQKHMYEQLWSRIFYTLYGRLK